MPEKGLKVKINDIPDSSASNQFLVTCNLANKEGQPVTVHDDKGSVVYFQLHHLMIKNQQMHSKCLILAIWLLHLISMTR